LQLQRDVQGVLSQKVRHVDFQHLTGDVQCKIDTTAMHQALSQKAIQGDVKQIQSDFQLVSSKYNRCGPQQFVWGGEILSPFSAKRFKLPFHLKTAWAVEHEDLTLMYHIQFFLVKQMPLHSAICDIRMVGYLDGKNSHTQNMFQDSYQQDGYSGTRDTDGFLECPQGGKDVKVKSYTSSDGFLTFSVDVGHAHPHPSVGLTVNFLGGCSSYLEAGKTTFKVTQAMHKEINL